MTDTGQNIIVEDEMSIAELEELQNETECRFTWTFTSNTLYVECTWRDYYKTQAGNRSKDSEGAWKLLPLQKKVVRIRT